jgi:hypothetical protein
MDRHVEQPRLGWGNDDDCIIETRANELGTIRARVIGPHDLHAIVEDVLFLQSQPL